MALPIITVWEGEWASLKKQVTVARKYLESSVNLAPVKSSAARWQGAVSESLERFDGSMTQASRAFSRELHQKRWIFPAAGIAGVGMLTFAKSSRWGLWAATRNGIVAAALVTAVAFPQDVRKFVTNKIPL